MSQPLTAQQVMDLQRLLIKQGYEGVGEVDGKVGSGTRSAVKKAQIEARPAGGFLSDRRIDRASERKPRRRQALAT